MAIPYFVSWTVSLSRVAVKPASQNGLGIGGVVGVLGRNHTSGKIGGVGVKGVDMCALPPWSHNLA